MRYAVIAAAALLPLTAAAQVPGSSSRAIGMAGAYTTLARGYESVVWNPAQLGMPGRTGFSLNIAQVGLSGYSNAFSLGDYRRWSDGFLSTADKDSILALVRGGDPDRPLVLGSGVDATTISVSVGSFAVALSGFAELQTAVADDAVELALYGNARRRAPGQTYSFTGTGGQAIGGASIAVAWGTELSVVPVGTLAVGATARYTQGVFVARAEDLGSTIQNAPNFDATVGMHALASDLDNSTSNGTGLALDLGGSYQLLSGLRFGLVIENALSSFSWKDDNLLYYRYAYRLQQDGETYEDSTIAEIDGVPFNAADPAQAALRDSLFGDAHPATRVRAGAGMDLGGLTVAGDLSFNVRDGVLDTGNKRMAAGAELTLIPVLRPRFGLATDLESGFSYAFGLGLDIGPVNADVGLIGTPGGDRKGFLFAFGLSIIS